jgi:hypothetical protein
MADQNFQTQVPISHRVGSLGTLRDVRVILEPPALTLTLRSAGRHHSR